MTHEMLVGAHTSIAGGVSNSLDRAKVLNANAMQIFTANQRQWKGKEISENEASKFKEERKKTQILSIMSHNNYLTNLGSAKKELLAISRKAFQEEIDRCHLLEIDYLVFHPGSAIGYSEEECLDTIIESLLLFKSSIKKGKTRLLLETTAGQGTNVGYKFEHLAYIINKIHSKMPIGVCLDTCHIFAAGYDIRTKAGWEKTISEFSKIVGEDYLYAFHINDSKTELGARKDRHASLGEGKIGLESFEFLMKEPKFKNMPKVLETPDDSLWKNEIELLKNFAR